VDRDPAALAPGALDPPDEFVEIQEPGVVQQHLHRA
jgi:hypothetical protein